MKNVYGVIVDVSTVNIGETVMTAAALGATSVVVADPTTFKEVGGQVSINGSVHDYTGIDVTAGTIILAGPGLEAAVAEDDRIELYPPASVKHAAIDLGIPEGEHIRVTVPHSLVAVLGEGMREEADRETVLLEERGIGDFYLKDVASTPAQVQSSTFVEGQSGWAFADREAQIDNLNVTAELGVDTLSARSIFLDGRDLSAETAGDLPKGAISYDLKTGSVNTAEITTTETKLFEFSSGQHFNDRLYRISAQGYINPTDAGSVFIVRLHFTTDGSTPTTSSPIMRTLRVPMTYDGLNPFYITKIYAGDDSDNIRWALTLQKDSGLGTANIDILSATQSLDMWVEDLGFYAAAAAAGQITQKSFSDATPPEGDPVRSYTKTWWATWTRSYDSNGATRSPDVEDLFQGYSSYSAHGNTRSLVGFDYAAIQTALSGATITSVKFTYRVKHVWDSWQGATVYVSSHSYTTKPSTWSSGSVTQNRANSAAQKEGSTYTKTLPVAVGNEFKAGTTRGLGFGPAPNNNSDLYFCYMYGGETSLSRPRITISYAK